MDWSSVFPVKSYPEKEETGHAVYRMNFPDGFGIMKGYQVLPGIILVFNDFHTACGFHSEAARPGFLEVNHCLRGCYECVLPDGRHVSLGSQDFSFTDMGRPANQSAFVLGEYYGLSLIIHVETAEKSLNTFLEEKIPFSDIFERLLYDDGMLILRADPKIQHIVSELYHAPDAGQQGYYKLKTLELILFLSFQCGDKNAAAHPCYCRKGVQRMEEIGRKMTEDLKAHYTLYELAQRYRISVTTLKNQFSKVYGDTPSRYLRRRRMEQAALLLKTTDMGVGKIAESVGYQNASKFSSAFADYYGMAPKEYKKDVVLE